MKKTNLYSISEKCKIVVRKQISIFLRMKVEARNHFNGTRILDDNENAFKLDCGDNDTVI